MIIYTKDIIKNLLAKWKWIVGLFAVLFVVTAGLFVAESAVVKTDGEETGITLSEDEMATALMYYRTSGFDEQIDAYQSHSILMKMDCNEVWFANLLYAYRGSDDWAIKHMLSGAFPRELTAYVESTLNNGESGYEDAVQCKNDIFVDTYVASRESGNSEADQKMADEPYYVLELYYYDEEGLGELEDCVKQFMELQGVFELDYEYSGRTQKYDFAQKQYNMHSTSYTLYSWKRAIKSQLTLNGERYFNGLVNGTEDNTGDPAPKSTINVKKTLVSAFAVAAGGILVQCAIYSFAYIQRRIKEQEQKE